MFDTRREREPRNVELQDLTPNMTPNTNREADLEEPHGWSLFGFTECLIQDTPPNPELGLED